MLIDFNRLPISKPVRGVIHIGAHECEERSEYLSHFGLNDTKIVWIDAINVKVEKMKGKNPNLMIFNECISNKDNEVVSFMVANNYESSSMLNFKTHSTEHPQVKEVARLTLKTKTLKTFYAENSIDTNNYNFINIDIQGAELLALQGAGDILYSMDYIYLEVNVAELYEGCCLLPEIDAYLTEYGFKRVLTEMTKHGWGDAFYTR